MCGTTQIRPLRHNCKFVPQNAVHPLFSLFHPRRRTPCLLRSSTTFVFLVLDSFPSQPSLKHRAPTPPANATRIAQDSSADATSVRRLVNPVLPCRAQTF